MLSRAGIATAPPPTETEDFCWASGCRSAGPGSGSRMSAPSPRPKAFLGIGNYLLGELRVAFRPFTMYIIENNRFTKTWRLRQAHIARDYGLKDLRAEEAAQVGGYLAR